MYFVAIRKLPDITSVAMMPLLQAPKTKPMEKLTSIQLALLATTLGLLMAQTMVKQKHTMHLLFALFLGSVAMGTAQKLSGDILGNYRYLVGMGACATCNVYWLLSRTLFRSKQALSAQHLLFALALGILIMFKQGYLFLDNLWQFDSATNQNTIAILGELTMMLSSCVLILTIWEGINGFQQATSTEKQQRLLFIITITSAIAICKTVTSTSFLTPDMARFVVSAVAVYVICTTQLLIFWISQTRKAALTGSGLTQQHSVNNPISDTQLAELTKRLDNLLCAQKRFLQPNLKVADMARELDVSEYLISRAIRHNSYGKNFNQHINALRIQHAQTLLQDAGKQHWSVLVIALESGFASIGPFNRAFKQICGVTPNQYRQEALQLQSLNCH